MKEELFAGLIRNPPKTVAEFVSKGTSIENMLDMRTTQYNRRTLTTNCADVQALESDDLRDTIRAVVREELQKLFSKSQPQVASIADIIKEEVQQSLGVTEVQLPSPQP